jgi:16S rRNA (adenine1518-N6/adenine1519-N6)-dimethyltransferase
VSDAPTLPPLREIVARHGIAARKGLGQHFLFDLNLTSRIARAAGPLAGRHVIEVGPGPGGLTRALLETGATAVHAIEKDARCLAALAELSAAFPGRLHIYAADATEIDDTTLAPAPRVVVANLPYNVSTVLLRAWLGRVRAYESLTLMFQREVAERLAAPPGGKDYGRLSVLTQWLCRVDMLFHIPARAFTPPPKIDSTVLRLSPRAEPLASASQDALERVTAAAFGQRRKMLRQSLKSLGVDAGALLDAGAIAPTRRAEELSVEEFCALARAFAATRLA